MKKTLLSILSILLPICLLADTIDLITSGTGGPRHHVMSITPGAVIVFDGSGVPMVSTTVSGLTSGWALGAPWSGVTGAPNFLLSTGTLPWSQVSGVPGFLLSSSTLPWAQISGVPSFVLSSGTIPWSQVSSTPTTRAGYGISDAEPTIASGSSTQVWMGNKTWLPLNTGNVPESGNLYYTDARARAAMSAGTGITLAGGTISLTATGTAQTTGDGTHTLTLTVNAQGQVTGITTNAITPSGIGALSTGTVTAPGLTITNSGTNFTLSGTTGASMGIVHVSSSTRLSGSTYSPSLMGGQFVFEDDTSNLYRYNGGDVTNSTNWNVIYQSTFDQIVLLNGTRSAIDTKNAGGTPQAVGEAAWITDENVLQFRDGSGNLYTDMPMKSSWYIVVRPTTSGTKNGQALLDAYNYAQALSPNGLSISRSNPSTIVILPGTYDLGTQTLSASTSFVNVVGINKDSTWITSSTNTLVVTATNIIMAGFGTYTTGTGSSYGFTPPTTFGTSYNGGAYTLPQFLDMGFFSSSGSNGFAQNASFYGTFKRCAGEDYCFGSLSNPNGSVTINSTFENCAAGKYSFGGANITGTGNGSITTNNCSFRNCTAYDGSFCSAVVAASVAWSGTLTDNSNYYSCISFGAGTCFDSVGTGSSASSTTAAHVAFTSSFNQCYGPSYAFGCVDAATGGTVSFNAYECRSGSVGFASMGKSPYTGTLTVGANFYDCSAGPNAVGVVSFMSSYSTTSTGTATFSGVAQNCVSNNQFFGARSASMTIKITGTIKNCSTGSSGGCFQGAQVGSGGIIDGVSGYQTSASLPLNFLSGSFGRNLNLQVSMPVTCAGKIERSSLTSVSANQDTITAQAGAAIYGSTIIATGTGKSINASGSISIPIAGCLMNTGLGSNVTNSITTPYNVVDSNVQ